MTIVEEMRAAYERLEQDAARYRWLRENPTKARAVLRDLMAQCDFPMDEAIDGYVDRARKEG